MQQTPNISELIRMAQTPAGQQLIALLQKQDSAQLQQAIAYAVSGDYNRAKAALSEMLSSPEAQALLKKLEDPK